MSHTPCSVMVFIRLSGWRYRHTEIRVAVTTTSKQCSKKPPSRRPSTSIDPSHHTRASIFSKQTTRHTLLRTSTHPLRSHPHLPQTLTPQPCPPPPNPSPPAPPTLLKPSPNPPKTLPPQLSWVMKTPISQRAWNTIVRCYRTA